MLKSCQHHFPSEKSHCGLSYLIIDISNSFLPYLLIENIYRGSPWGLVKIRTISREMTRFFLTLLTDWRDLSDLRSAKFTVSRELG